MGLAGCAVTIVGRDEVTHQDRPWEVGAVGGGGNQLRVEVTGNPFDMADDEFANTVLGQIEGKVGWVNIDFSLNPTKEYVPKHRVVLLFSPEGASPRLLCNTRIGHDATKATLPANVRVFGAFCRGGFALSYASGRVGDVEGPQSARLAALMAQMTMTLFPQFNRNLENTAFTQTPDEQKLLLRNLAEIHPRQASRQEGPKTTVGRRALTPIPAPAR